MGSGWVLKGFQEFTTDDRELMSFQGAHSGELLTNDVWADANSLQLFKNALKSNQTKK